MAASTLYMKTVWSYFLKWNPPQAFLKSEVSDENILFWQACEKFRKIPATNLDEVSMPSHRDEQLMDEHFSVLFDSVASVFVLNQTRTLSPVCFCFGVGCVQGECVRVRIRALNDGTGAMVPFILVRPDYWIILQETTYNSCIRSLKVMNQKSPFKRTSGCNGRKINRHTRCSFTSACPATRVRKWRKCGTVVSDFLFYTFSQSTS